MIAAILRAQILSMRLAGRRGALFSAITGAIWYGFWCFIAATISLFAASADAASLRLWVPGGLLLVCLYWQFVPILSASMGSGLDLRKLQIYPAPHGRLFFVEILLRLTTALEMILVLAGAAAGVLRNPLVGLAAAPRLVPLLIFVLFNLFLASGTRSLLERLLSHRRLREVLVFFLLIAVTAPRILFVSGVRSVGIGRFDSIIHFPGLPWASAGQAALGGSVLRALAVLAGWTFAAAWFGRAQFERSLRFDSAAAQSAASEAEAPSAESWSERLYRFPSHLFRDPLAVIVEKELRSLSRTPRFRMVFVMGFSFGVMVWLPAVMGRQAARHSTIEQNFLVVVCAYAMTLLGQVTYWNCFGFDRSAVQFYFAAPQPISQTLLGKNFAYLVFIYLEVLILVFITMLLRVDWRPAQLAETLAVVSICSLYMMAFGNISSVRYPRALTPERVSQGGASSRFQALVFILYPLALAPVFLSYLARYAFDSQTVFIVALAFSAILGAVLYWQAVESAVKTLAERREQILTDLSQGEGPVSAT